MISDKVSQFYIGGAWVAPISGATMAVENPATEQAIAELPLANSADADKAVRNAALVLGVEATTEKLIKKALN